MDNAPAAPPPAAAPAGFPAVGTLLSASTSAVLDNAGVLVALWALVAVPAFAAVFGAILLLGIHDKETARAFLNDLNAVKVVSIGTVILVFLAVSVITRFAAMLALGRALRGEGAEFGELLGTAASRAVSAVFASVVAGMAITAAALLFLLPGIYVAVRLCLTGPAVVLDGTPALDALKRSWALTSGRFWDMAAALCAIFFLAIVGGIAVLAATAVIKIAAALAGGAAGSALSGMATNALQFVLGAWVTGCLVKLYVDLAAQG